MAERGIPWEDCERTGTIVHLAVEGSYAGHIVISDEVKPEASGAIAALRAGGVKKTVMLTGDAKEVGEAVARELGLDEVHSQLLPGDTWVQDEETIAASRRLAECYKDIARLLNIGFADAGGWGIGLTYDGVHFSEMGHLAFAKGIQQALTMLVSKNCSD